MEENMHTAMRWNPSNDISTMESIRDVQGNEGLPIIKDGTSFHCKFIARRKASRP
jgi:hypothetical protein